VSEDLTKRQRQKQRRDQKLAQQRVEAQRSRRNRVLAFIALGVVVVGLIGLFVQQQLADRAEVAAAEERAEAKLTELGCTPDEAVPAAGAGHLDGAQLAASPPDVLYPDRPAASGMHFGSWAQPGVYDERVDERFLVHNLEHGFVTVYYRPDAPEEQIEQAKAFGREQLGEFDRLIVAPLEDGLPEDVNFGFVSWNVRQLCEQFDTDVALSFLTQHHGFDSEAPEVSAGAGGGTFGPDDDGPFLLPPLGDAPAGEESPAAEESEPAAEESESGAEESEPAAEEEESPSS
jgi:hypothetical protein